MTKNVIPKLFSTKKLLTQNPMPPLINRTDEFRLAIMGRSQSEKSVMTAMDAARQVGFIHITFSAVKAE